MSGDDRLDQLDYYTLLGVARDASFEEIRAAFRAFARKYHPDRFAGQSREKIERATRIYRRGSEAVQTLTDVVSRRAYDAALARGELRLRTDARAAHAPPGSAAARSPATSAAAAPSAIRSPSARAFFARAEALVRAGEVRAAYEALRDARAQEPGNPLIEAALQKVEAHLRARR